MNVALSGEWELWPEFAVRSTGFPASGLDVFGPEDEEERLVAVARDPRFREALAWQNREVLARISHLESKNPSERRRRLDMVASYWQRYCAKNDTIGFFGPLAWGTFAERTALRAGTVDHERVVHFETWAMEALHGRPAADGAVPRARARARHARAGPAAAARAPRSRPTTSRLGSRRSTPSSPRSPDGKPCAGTATAAADARSPTWTACAICRSRSARRCWRRWASRCRRCSPPRAGGAGACSTVGAALLGQIARDGPLAPQLGPLMGAGFGLWDQMGEEQADLRRRWAETATRSPITRPRGTRPTTTRRTSRSRRQASTRSPAATSDSCSATSTAAISRSPKVCSGSAIPTRRRCCAGSAPNAAPACTCHRRAAAWWT